LLEHPEPDLPLGVAPDFTPAIHALSVPEAALLVFYTDGVSESERDSVQGTFRLPAAGTFAHDFPDLPTAETIEAMTLSTTSNFDDTAILTARMPLIPITRNRRGTANGRGRHFAFAEGDLGGAATSAHVPSFAQWSIVRNCDAAFDERLARDREVAEEIQHDDERSRRQRRRDGERSFLATACQYGLRDAIQKHRA